MDHIAVVGPGLMGLGIAQLAAGAGFVVRLVGRDGAAAQAGRQRLADQLAKQVAKGRLAPSGAMQLLDRVVPVRADDELADCALAIESVPEDRALKAAVFERLQRALPPTALIATNTSGLPVGGLARALDMPGRFVGLHFFSPVERMKLVEVVRGAETSDNTLAAALVFVRRLRQVPVVVRDGPGFFTSRVFAAYLDEALALVAEGVPAERIDTAAVGLGRAIGPLALLDEISLALNLQQIHQARADGLPPERCRPLGEPVLAAMLAAGRGGRRQGGGFYDVSADGSRAPWPGLATLFPRQEHELPTARLQQRLRLAEVLEALRCVESGVVADADDADTASLLGLAFPRETGGVLRWAEHHGLAALVNDADVLAVAHGDRFRPSAWLRQLAVAAHGLPRERTPMTERMTSP